MIKAAVMGIAAAMLALYMKSVRPEYSSMISISAGIFIFKQDGSTGDVSGKSTDGATEKAG